MYSFVLQSTHYTLQKTLRNVEIFTLLESLMMYKERISSFRQFYCVSWQLLLAFALGEIQKKKVRQNFCHSRGSGLNNRHRGSFLTNKVSICYVVGSLKSKTCSNFKPNLALFKFKMSHHSATLGYEKETFYHLLWYDCIRSPSVIKFYRISTQQRTTAVQ